MEYKLINPTEVNVPIVERDNSPTQSHFQIINDLSQLEVRAGEGSPEGVLKEKAKTLYMDTNGTTGSILYIKTTGIDDDTGWVMV
jgi:hypothetical protein